MKKRMDQVIALGGQNQEDLYIIHDSDAYYRASFGLYSLSAKFLGREIMKVDFAGPLYFSVSMII